QAINHYPWSDPAWFVAHSPLFQADHVTAPLLLLHGGADVNVPPGESEQMFTALRLLNRTAELVLFPGEDHGIAGSWKSRAEHRTMLAEWFDRFLRSEPAAWNERWE
ncbi:MAG: prolyl oligopeptidase family serine peptidase, partial [Planctomycetes bacterium]|nr:prolyl oligopeptidase family serine peptidase [Planctomycetota bacterium]